MHHFKQLKRLLRCFYLVFFLWTDCPAQQALRFQTFTSEDGLSENFVYSLHQDQKGFLWIGTHDGLNRYDGYTFKKFRHLPGDSNSLPNNTILSIAEDRTGNLWLGTNEGICRFSPEANSFLTINLQKKLRSVQQVVVLNANEIMVWADKQLRLIDMHKKTEIPLFYKDRSGVHPIHASRTPIAKDKQGNIYVSLYQHGDIRLLKYNRQENCFTYFATLSVPAFWKQLPIFTFYIDSGNRFWLSADTDSTYVFDTSPIASQQPHYKPVQVLRTNAVRRIYEDRNGMIWIASTTGLLSYDQKSKKTEWLKNSLLSTGSLSSDDVQDILQDGTGILWIATANGLNKLNPGQKNIAHLVQKPKRGEGLFNNFVLGVYPETEEQLRIHYNIYEDRHFTRYNTRHQTFSHFSYADYDPHCFAKEVLVRNPEKLRPELLQTIVRYFQDADGPQWPSNNGASQIWISTWNQLWGNYGQALRDLRRPNDIWLQDTLIVDMQLRGNELWIISAKGLIFIDTRTLSRRFYESEPANTSSLSANDLTCFLFDNDNNIWIGTKGGGLNFFDRKKERFRRYTEKEGLCNNSIYSMVKDKKGRLWLGTSQGLSCFDPATQIFRNFYPSDGCVNIEYNRYSACLMPDGRIFMGGMKGIDVFNPEALLNNSTVPGIQLTEISIFNKSIPVKELSRLSHDQNSITFSFAAMDFKNPAGNGFSCILEGADQEWTHLQGRNFAVYSYLPPGNYFFKVKAANSNGVWNSAPLTVQFTILPPWYNTWWFYFLCVLFFVGTVYLLFRSHLQHKLAILQIRNRLHRDLHDDLGATMSSIKVSAELLGKNGTDPIIRELIRQNAADMIDRLEVISWATNPLHDNVKSLVSVMLRFARPVLYTKGTELVLETKNLNDETILPGDIRQNILLIYKEAINNVIKYAEASRCNVCLLQRNHQLILEIKDNGRGSDGTIKGGGAGIKNMQKRAEEMGGTLDVQIIRNEGTTINLSIPYPLQSPGFSYPKVSLGSKRKKL